MDKSKQIWYLWKTDVKNLTTECYKILQELYIQLGQKPESEMVVLQTNTLVEDLASNYSRMELEEVKFALNKGLRDNDPPIFINVPTWNKFLRDYKKSAIEEYTIYKKRMEEFGKVLKTREIKKIG